MTSAVSPDPHRAFPAPAAQCWRSPRPHSGRLLRADWGQVKVLSARQQKGKRQHAVQCISMRADNALNTARATADALSWARHIGPLPSNPARCVNMSAIRSEASAVGRHSNQRSRSAPARAPFEAPRKARNVRAGSTGKEPSRTRPQPDLDGSRRLDRLTFNQVRAGQRLPRADLSGAGHALRRLGE